MGVFPPLSRRSPPSSLPQVLLNAAPLLTPEDVRAVAFGLSTGRPRKAQLLLQEAVEKRRAKQSGGSLVLVLDKVSIAPRSCFVSPRPCRPPALTFLLLLLLLAAPAEAAVGEHGVSARRPRHPPPVPALPPQLLAGTGGERTRGTPPKPLGTPPNPRAGLGPIFSPLWQRGGSVLSRGVNPSSAFYILNPDKNLPSTEEQFRGWFER